MAERRSLKAKGIVLLIYILVKNLGRINQKKLHLKSVAKNNKGLDLGCITTSQEQDYGRISPTFTI